MPDHANNAQSRIGKIRNIIFDMDGTLINTAIVTIPACQKAAEKFGLPIKSANEIKQLIGYADPEFCYKLYPDSDKDILNKFSIDVGKRENELTREFGTDVLFPGVQEMLNILKQHKFYISIASTGSEDHVEISLQTSGIFDMFNIIKCNKPEKTEMVKYIVENGPKGEWLIIGDKSSDLNAGKNNGIVTIAARYGFGSEMEYNQFDFSINTPHQLLEFFEL
jgi:phosphoglycolate phosphatase-like HAD superfamily hydrolase